MVDIKIDITNKTIFSSLFFSQLDVLINMIQENKSIWLK